MKHFSSAIDSQPVDLKIEQTGQLGLISFVNCKTEFFTKIKTVPRVQLANLSSYPFNKHTTVLIFCNQCQVKSMTKSFHKIPCCANRKQSTSGSDTVSHLSLFQSRPRVVILPFWYLFEYICKWNLELLLLLLLLLTTTFFYSTTVT